MERIEKLCADRGMRMTEQRRVIARVLSQAEDHPDVEELYRRASAIDPHISIATVYRTVRLFEEAGVVEKHDFGKRAAQLEKTMNTANEILRCGRTIADTDAERQQLITKCDMLRPWAALDVPLNFHGTDTTTAFIGTALTEALAILGLVFYLIA